MITVKNWKTFQHYKHRDPPWIRLYRGLLNDREWHNLDGEAAKALVMLWLLASEHDGQLPAVADLAFRLRLTEKQTTSILPRLSHWLVQDASTTLAPRYQDAPTETETETETETDIYPSKKWPENFRDQFWNAYPRKVGKGSAIRKLEAIRASGEIEFHRLLAAIGHIEASDPKFIPHPTTWLNQGRYLDLLPAATADPLGNGGWRPGLPTEEELRTQHADRRKAQEPTGTGADVLAPSASVCPEKPNGLDRHHSGNGGVPKLGSLFPQQGMGAVCDPPDTPTQTQNDPHAR